LLQWVAPMHRTLPNTQDGFYALALYLAPRYSLNQDWALTADVTVSYEVTPPDDAEQRHKVWTTDTRLTALGNWGTYKGFTFTGGPRLVLPTSQASWAAKVYVGTGGVVSVTRSFDVLAGSSVNIASDYWHTWSGDLTPEIRDGNPPTCASVGSGNGASTDCTAGSSRVIQDSIRLFSIYALNFTPAWNLQVAYLYGWRLVKPFRDDTPTVEIASGPVQLDREASLADSRWRRYGDFEVALSYQPASWLITSLTAATVVCYDHAYGAFSANGVVGNGTCSGGMKSSDFWLRNPIANKFTTVALQLTVPIDALLAHLSTTSASGQRKSAAKSHASAL
jgi:hypothetical protein